MPREKIKMAMDANGQPIQGALCPRRNGGEDVTIGAAATVSNELLNAEIVRLCATSDCHIRFGDFSTVAAVVTDLLLPKGLPEYFSLKGNRWISVIQDSAGGTLNVQIMD